MCDRYLVSYTLLFLFMFFCQCLNHLKQSTSKITLTSQDQINERISRHYLLLFTPSRYNLIPVTGLLPTVTWLYLLNNVISMYYEIKLQNMETLQILIRQRKKILCWKFHAQIYTVIQYIINIARMMYLGCVHIQLRAHDVELQGRGSKRPICSWAWAQWKVTVNRSPNLVPLEVQEVL